MDKRLIWGPILAIALYMFLPWLLTRVLGLVAYSKGKTPGKVAFTFDDGPDPVYTPLLLDLLKTHHVKATFFVLGSLAEKYPEIVKRIHNEGHEIGVHNYTHKSNWLMMPWTVNRQQIQRTVHIIENITGEAPVLYRPPWGIMNLFDFLFQRKLKMVLWSVMAGDWSSSSNMDENRLTKKLLNKIDGGSIVLLHDSGRTLGAKPEAPKYMLKALSTVLDTLSKHHYSYVSVSEMMLYEAKAEAVCMSRTKKTIVALWLQWERLFVKMFNIIPIDEHNTMLKLRVRAYSGDREIELEDGEVIRKGDQIAELHLDNELLFQLGADARSTMHLTVQLIRRMEQLLPQINELIMHHPDFKNVKGLYGISIIHRGTTRFGFTVIDLPEGLFSYFTRLYLRLLMYVIHPQGKERMQTKSELLVPKIIAISKQELANRYTA